MPSSSVILTDEDRALLLKVSSLPEEIIETLDILEDEGDKSSYAFTFQAITRSCLIRATGKPCRCVNVLQN